MYAHVFSLNFTIQSEDAEAKDVTHEEVMKKVNFLLGKYKGENLMMFVDHLESRLAKNAS
jgi:hypothetical protein